MSAALSPPPTASDLRSPNAYCRAANARSVGQVYLLGNPLLREPRWPYQMQAVRREE